MKRVFWQPFAEHPYERLSPSYNPLIRRILHVTNDRAEYPVGPLVERDQLGAAPVAPSGEIDGDQRVVGKEFGDGARLRPGKRRFEEPDRNRAPCSERIDKQRQSKPPAGLS